MAKRLALIALLALASHAFLPYLHSLSSDCDPHQTVCGADDPGPSHSPECPVCSAIAHGGAADVPVALHHAVTAGPAAAAPHAPEVTVQLELLDPALARAPPLHASAS